MNRFCTLTMLSIFSVQAARSSVDIGVSKPDFQDSGEFVLSVTDLFNGFGLKHNIIGDGFDAVYENYYETQVVSLGLTYRF